MPKKKQDDKHNSILEAATRVFAQKGFHNAKIADVASEAGVAHGTVYLYFESKEALLISIFRENLRWLMDYFKKEIEKESKAEDKLRRIISLQIEVIDTNPELTALMLVEFPQTGKFLSSDAICEIAEYMDMIEKILKEGIAEGIFENDMDSGVVATVIFSGIQGIATRWILEGMKYHLDKVSNDIAETFLRGIKISS